MAKVIGRLGAMCVSECQKNSYKNGPRKHQPIWIGGISWDTGMVWPACVPKPPIVKQARLARNFRNLHRELELALDTLDKPKQHK